MDSAVLAALFALSAATAWGSGDFTGGVVARRIGPFHTILLTYTVSLLVLVLLAVVRLEQLPAPVDLVWGAAAGLAGMMGYGFLLRGFASGRMGVVAPVSAVLATAIPVIFTALTQGLPPALQLLGFGLAIASIWMLSRPEPLGGRPAGLGMALLAGVGFGAFFTALDQISEDAVFWPLAASRLAAWVVLVGFALLARRSLVPQVSPLGLLVLAGLLDVGGNLFFLLAVQSGRLDIAAVLGSLYPAVTAILAWLITREHMAWLQALGVVIAVAAIVLITL
jgi:drug/metabolite transporter (DMT)-like permease